MLSVVIVHYRSLQALPRCLSALAAETAGLQREVVIVDNDSRDGLAEWLAREHPDVRSIANASNLGYARGVNQGIAATSGAHVLVMNPDVYLEPGCLSTLLEHLRSHPGTGLVAPELRNPDGTVEFSARSFPGAWTFLFNRYSLLTRLFPANPWSRRYLLTDWDRAAAREVDWVSGACMLVRREAIQAAGPMDEGFFMFNEDVDWCRRLRNAGWAVVCEPRARRARCGREPEPRLVQGHRGAPSRHDPLLPQAPSHEPGGRLPGRRPDPAARRRDAGPERAAAPRAMRT